MADQGTVPSDSTNTEQSTLLDSSCIGDSRVQDPTTVNKVPKDTEEEPYYCVPECEVFEKGGPEAKDRLESCGCGDRFTPVKKFMEEASNSNEYSAKQLEGVKNMMDRTVNIVVKRTSNNRPDFLPNSTTLLYPYARYRGYDTVTRTGTGFIYDKRAAKVEHEKCPCHDCKTSEDPKTEYFKVHVCTAAHVVFDDSEAEVTVCEVFFDDPENRDSVHLLYGVRGVDGTSVGGVFHGFNVNDVSERGMRDLFCIECVTHDKEFYEVLASKITKASPLDSISLRGYGPLIVSHPHGCSKQVSVGTYKYLEIKLSESHSPDTPYPIAVDTRVETDLDVTSQYPGFFQSIRPEIDTWYKTTQPLKFYLKYESSQLVKMSFDQGTADTLPFPLEFTITTMGDSIEFPTHAIQVHVFYLLRIIRDNLVSCRLVYDTPTCKGSSGAHLPGRLISHMFFPCHWGKLSTGDNRSGDYDKVI